MKEIDLQKSLFELTEQYPELVKVLVELGFAGVANPALRSSHGKVMTIPKGAAAMGKDLNQIVQKLREEGFTVKPTG